MKTTDILIIVVVAAAIAVGGYFYMSSLNAPGEYDELAQCLTEKGATIYGTDWCSFCKKQKELFGQSFRLVNYKNCDTDRASCDLAGVTRYPSWVINGQLSIGVKSLEELASATGCEL